MVSLCLFAQLCRWLILYYLPKVCEARSAEIEKRQPSNDSVIETYVHRAASTNTVHTHLLIYIFSDSDCCVLYKVSL